MQNIYHDGGFSNMGMSLKAMTQYNKCLEDEAWFTYGNFLFSLYLHPGKDENIDRTHSKTLSYN